MNNAARQVTRLDAIMKIPSRHSFTLIEVLIVIGILAVLLAIIVPVSSHARENWRRTTCQSNLRQIAIAMQQYVQDNDGMYPSVIPVRTAGEPTKRLSWQEVLFPYTKSRDVFLCPSYPVELFYDQGYVLNALRLNTTVQRFPTVKVSGTPESRLLYPSTTWLTADNSWLRSDGVCDFCREVPITSCGRPFRGSTVHGGGANYAFLDGHVKWLLPEAIAETDCKNAPLFSSSDN